MLDTWALKQSVVKKRIAAAIYEQRNILNAHCLHALCAAEHDQIRAFGYKGPVAIVPNGVDPPGQEAADGLIEIPESWSDRRVCLFLSRVHPKKGLAILVDAFSRLPQHHKQWAIAIAGPDEGGHAGELAERIRSHALTDHIQLVGPQYGRGKATWFRRADAFVLPSFSEGFPMAVLEAMSYGLPVLITPECNFPEALEHGAAFSASPGVDEMADALNALMSSSQETLQKMGNLGKSLAESDYTWPGVASRMLDVYRWMAGSGAKPNCIHEA
jgi:poly(glycerol-phosphate) alpha-glucosyltransferase